MDAQREARQDVHRDAPGNPHRTETRRQQQVEELCAAMIRALSGDPAMRFRGRLLHRGEHPMPLLAPHLTPSLAHDDFASLRGAADGVGLRLAESSLTDHLAAQPVDPVERVLFDLLEQLRVESHVPAGLPGAARNLDHRHLQWTLAFHAAGLTETAAGLLVFSIAQVCRARLNACGVPEAIEGVIEHTRAALHARIGRELAQLRRTRHDQRAFAPHALAIAHAAAAMLRQAQPASGQPEARRLDEAARAALGLLADERDRPPADVGTGDASTGDAARRIDDGAAYRVFTRAWDREAPASEFARATELAQLRARLDARAAAQGANLARLARALQAVLARPRHDGWNDGEEEGEIDGRRLSQLIASPLERRLFRQPRERAATDCAVTLLIDCSGSMKAHAESVAMLADLLARALEQAGAVSEVLGFTTGAWNGGRARRDWMRAGRPPMPGRLAELCHLVFKDADTSWRRARLGLAALLKTDLYREGIDGEALAWAAARLRSRKCERRVLLVVSDGSPMDAATSLANDPRYLDRHLRETVARLQAEAIEVRGLGVGLDLSPYYGAQRAVDLSPEMGNAAFDEVVGLMRARRHPVDPQGTPRRPPSSKKLV